MPLLRSRLQAELLTAAPLTPGREWSLTELAGGVTRGGRPSVTIKASHAAANDHFRTGCGYSGGCDPCAGFLACHPAAPRIASRVEPGARIGSVSSPAEAPSLAEVRATREAD
jgi:hypothetical protein